MRKLEYLVIHCSATPEGRNVTKEEIVDWHTAPKPRGNGWKKVGYADLIGLNGQLDNLVDYNYDPWVDSSEVTNGARGYNSVSRHICYVGGVNKGRTHAMDTRTPQQKETLEVYVKYMIKRHSDIKIVGHNFFNPNKACPAFDVRMWCIEIGIPSKNIG
jgi:hypothetical protein